MAETEAQRSAPSYRKDLDKPRNKMRIIRGILDGKQDDQLALELGVQRTSVYRFRLRHAAEIEELTERFLTETADYLIADKRTRIADYDEMRTLMRAESVANPVTLEETRYGVKRRPNPSLETWLRVDQQAALEMDQLPRAGITVNNQNVVIVKQVVSDSGNPEL